jgi:hypothetical protein
MINALAIGTAWLSLLPFYRVDFPVDLVPGEMIYVEFNKGHEVRRKNLSEKEIHALKEFFTKNKKGWRGDAVTYAPNHVFTSANMKINCFKGGDVVVNYADKDLEWKQIAIKESVGACPASILDEATVTGPAAAGAH